MYLCIWFAEVFDDLLLPLVIIFVTDTDKVIPARFKLSSQMYAMIHTTSKNNSLAWLTKYLKGFLFPFLYHIACNLHTASASLCLAPLSGHLLSTGHVDLFGYEYTQRHEYLIIYQLLSSNDRDHVVVYLAEPLCKWGGSQPDDTDIRIVFDELNCLFACLMALVHD